MKTFFGILGALLFGASYLCFGQVRNNLEREQALSSAMATLFDHPEMAQPKEITRADLVDFEKLEKREDGSAAIAYLGLATGVGGAVCLGAAAMIGLARRPKQRAKANPKPVGAAS